MDVNNTDARREIDTVNRLLRDREIEHAREIDNLRDSQRQQIDELTTTQQDNIKRIRKDTDDALNETRNNFDEQIRKNTDSYEKTIADNRAEAYDKYGRLASEAARERAKADGLKSRQINQLMDAQEEQLKGAREERDKTLSKARESDRHQLLDTERRYEKMLADKNQDTILQVEHAHNMAKDHENDYANKVSADAFHQKQMSDSHYRKLAEDSANERSRIVSDSKAREEQLNADHAFNQRQSKNQFEKVYDDYRQRAHEALTETIAENNLKASQTRRGNEAKLALTEQQTQAEKQRLRNDFRTREADLKNQMEMERDAAELHAAMAEKRHRQELFINESATHENNELNNQALKDHFQDTIHDLDTQHRHEFERHNAAIQNKMYSQESLHTNERAELEREKNTALNQATLDRAREKNYLIRAYETRQRAADELHERQFADAKGALDRDMKALRKQTDKDISMTNHEKQAQLYEAHRTLMDRTNELEFQRKMELDGAESKYADAAKRMNTTYNRSLLATQDSFDEASSEYRHETMMQMAKSRGDAEHEKRMALLDLLTKNRAIMAGLESKMNQMKDDHDAELAKLKTDNDKAMREVMKRAKEQLDTEHTLHSRELEAKDMQTKEKLRLQEEAFKDTIEKLKRSHELALKKS